MRKLERYRPDPVDFHSWEESRKAMDGNWEKLRRIDGEAKIRGSLLGRYIAEPYADGQAFYQITRVEGNKVGISVCSGLGDDWVIPYWGAVRSYQTQLCRGKHPQARRYQRTVQEARQDRYGKARKVNGAFT